MHEFGIIGLHAKPDDVFNELNELDRVYEVVSSLFATPVSRRARPRNIYNFLFVGHPMKESTSGRAIKYLFFYYRRHF